MTLRTHLSKPRFSCFQKIGKAAVVAILNATTTTKASMMVDLWWMVSRDLKIIAAKVRKSRKIIAAKLRKAGGYSVGEIVWENIYRKQEQKQLTAKWNPSTTFTHDIDNKTAGQKQQRDCKLQKRLFGFAAILHAAGK